MSVLRSKLRGSGKMSHVLGVIAVTWVNGESADSSPKLPEPLDVWVKFSLYGVVVIPARESVTASESRERWSQFVKMSRPALSTIGENAPLGAWCRRTSEPAEVGSRLHSPLTVGRPRYSSRCKRCGWPL